MYLLKQRLIGGGDKEPEGFKDKKKQCMAMRDGLKKCEKSIKAWMEGAEKMSSAAETMAELASSSDSALSRLGNEISVALGPQHSLKVCTEAIESISLKIKLVDKLKKECADLEEKRLIMNRLKRKAEDAQKKEDPAHREKATREHEESVHAHAQLFAEVDGSFDFLLEEDGGQNGVGLAQPEMTTFKMSTVEFFKSCNEICMSLVPESVQSVDLKQEWEKFNDRKDAKVNALRDDKMALVGSSRSMADAGSAFGGSSSRLGSNESYHTADSSSGIAPPPPPPPSMGASTATTTGKAPPPPPPPSSSTLSSYGLTSSGAQGGRPPPPRPPSARPTPPPPPTSQQPSGPQATAIYAYAPQNPDELALSVGVAITITKQEEDGWWEGVLANGKRGVFPSNYVQLVGDEEDDVDSDYEGNV